MPDGRIEPRQVERLREMGAWLAKYGKSLYGTRGGPFLRGSWGAATYRQQRIYLHLLDPARDPVLLPPIAKKIVASSVLTGGTATVKQTDEQIEVSVPAQHRQEIDTIVVLDLDGPAAEAAPGRLATGSLATGKPVKASNVFQNQVGQHGPAKAVDDDPETRWATDYGTRQASLEVDIGQPTTLGRVAVRECVDFGQRVRKFAIQYRDGDAWKTILEGTVLGPEYARDFAPVTAQHVRLNILDASEGPTIWEFDLFPPKR